MKIILTEQQYRYICEQQNLGLKGKTLSPKAAPPKGFGKSNPQGNLHDVATVLAIATVFIPVVGPFISAGIGLADAALYYKEGDAKTAGLVAAFSMLPAVGSVVSKIPGVKQLGVKGMASLASRLSKGAQITNPVEVAVVNGINLNKNLVQNGLNSQVRTLAQQGASRATNAATRAELTNLAKNGVKEVGGELATDKAVELIRAKIS
jgi:hypothetical protein